MTFLFCVLDEDVGGAVCMTNVVVTALCSLARRYIIMESAAAAAGDRLMDLTSRDGDWFLDELCSMSANINQMIALIADPAMVSIADLPTFYEIKAEDILPFGKKTWKICMLGKCSKVLSAGDTE